MLYVNKEIKNIKNVLIVNEFVIKVLLINIVFKNNLKVQYKKFRINL